MNKLNDIVFIDNLIGNLEILQDNLKNVEYFEKKQIYIITSRILKFLDECRAKLKD